MLESYKDLTEKNARIKGKIVVPERDHEHGILLQLADKPRWCWDRTQNSDLILAEGGGQRIATSRNDIVKTFVTVRGDGASLGAQW